MRKTKKSMVVLFSCCIVGVVAVLALAGVLAIRKLSAGKISFVTVNWRPGIVYAVSPYCRVVRDKITGEITPFVVLDTKTLLPTNVQFCGIGLFEAVAVSDDVQLIIMKSDRLRGYFAVDSALAWENSAADPLTDPAGTHPLDIGKNSFSELVFYMCQRGDEYLTAEQREKKCP